MAHKPFVVRIIQLDLAFLLRSVSAALRAHLDTLDEVHKVGQLLAFTDNAASDSECLAPGVHPFEPVVVICSPEQGVHTQETVPAFAESKCTNRTGPARSCHNNQGIAHAHSTPQAPLLSCSGVS